MITFFKANKKNTGAVFQLYPANKTDRNGNNYPELSGCAFIQLTKQNGWDENKKIGYFKGSFEDKSKNIILMINQAEIGEILQCIRDKRALNCANIDYSSFDATKKTSNEASFFHKTPTTSKVLKFFPRHENCSTGEFVVSLADNGASIYIGTFLTSGEVRLLEEALVSILQTYFQKEAEKAVVNRVKNNNRNESDGRGKKDIQNKRSRKPEPEPENDLEQDEYDDPSEPSDQYSDETPF